MLNELKENDLLLVTNSFYYTSVEEKPKKTTKSAFCHDKAETGSVLLVLENNFGATYKDRFTICLLSNRKIYISSRGLNSALSNQLENCFEILNV